jgi:ribosomal protein L31E
MVTERVYNIPLRKGFHDVAPHKKTKRAVATLQEFLSRHMKQPDMDKVLIGKNLNKELWKHGIKNPPCQVKVVVVKDDNGDVKAELYGFKYEHKKKEQKEEKTTDSKLETKAKDAKKKSTTEETHEGHDHGAEPHAHHEHEEKHEHAQGHTHEHPAAAKPATKKASAKKKAE